MRQQIIAQYREIKTPLFFIENDQEFQALMDFAKILERLRVQPKSE